MGAAAKRRAVQAPVAQRRAGVGAPIVVSVHLVAPEADEQEVELPEANADDFVFRIAASSNACALATLAIPKYLSREMKCELESAG